jgi:hypothetical protein
MQPKPTLQEYQDEIRSRVCSRCVERLPHGPPCEPLGKRCAIETELKPFVDAIHEVESPIIEPYLQNIKRRVCSHCPESGGANCPCPLNYLLVLTVEAIEAVDIRATNAFV